MHQPYSKTRRAAILLVLSGVFSGVIFVFSLLTDARLLESWGISSRYASFFSARRMRKERIRTLVWAASREYDVAPELIWAVITVESNFDPGARSPRGAIGLMQLMPETARYMKVSDPEDPYQNILGGTRYLRYLLDKYEGRKELALAAYNAGPGAVRRHGGIPPYGETRRYVKKVLAVYRQEQEKRSQALSL